MYIHVYKFISLYVHCTYTFIDFYVCLNTVQTVTRLSSFKTTPNFPSGPISLAMSLSSVQEPLLLSSHLPDPVFSNDRPPTWLATPKLPQPLVHLIHIAATPAIHCCSVTGAHREARPLVLAVLVRNCRGRVIKP